MDSSEVWEIDRKLMEHGKTPLDVTEFDQWVNEATRKDINKIVSEKDVFGLKFWTWDILERNELKNVGNFGVDVILKRRDREKILELIEKYKNGKISAREIVDIIFDMAVYVCEWV